MTLTVDVFSDVICPWCFIGKRRLEKAIGALDGRVQVHVRWRPFQLNPSMPKEGISRRDYRTAKFGSWERSLELDAKVTAVGKQEGIAFALDRIERTPNTVDAHGLAWLAENKGMQDAVVEALFNAYFTAGRDIGCRQTLTDVGTAAGLDRQTIAELLDGHDGSEALNQAAAQARRHRVEGVPFFIIDGKITLAGAQHPDTFLAAFKQAAGIANHIG